MPKALLRAALAAALLSPLPAMAQPLPVPPILHPRPPMPVRPVRHDAFATPRYVAIAASGEMKPMDGARMCVGGGDFLRAMDARRDAARAQGPEAAAQRLKDLNKGCTDKFDNAASGVLFHERTCRRADGATRDSYARESGTLNEMHNHVEMTVPNATGRGPDRHIVSDTTMTYLGPCPANLKPGQLVDRDGKIRDMPAPGAARDPAAAGKNSPAPSK